jgi:hypothetical protein
MDFLDPRKTRRSQIRLMVGYVMVAILIALATVVLVYDAYGYGLDTKTGNIIEKGLLFMDSKPGGANIYLNGENQNNTTSARFVLPAGNYTLSLKKNGYRSWQRTFTLSEHSIERYVYPFLFPTKPVTASLKTYSSQPNLVMQSPDRRWLLVSSSSTDTTTASFDEFDTTNLGQASKSINIPSGLLTGANLPGSSLSVVEWSTDNVNVLLKHVYQGGDEFIVLNRQDPTKSYNVNKLLNVSPSQVALRNKKVNQLYIYKQSGGTLQVGDTSKATLDTPILRNVLAFKAYGSNLLTYVTNNGVPAGHVTARIWDNGKNYLLSTFVTGNIYLIDAAQFQGHWYYVAGSDKSDRVNIFKDPLDKLHGSFKAAPLMALRQTGGTKISFSANTRFVVLEAGQSFAVYDFEAQSYYHYTLPAKIDDSLHWMDGHRLIGSTNGKIFIMDYDSINRQTLSSTLLPNGGDFDRDYNHLITFVPSSSPSQIILQSIDLRAGSDLPKNTLQN